MARIYVVTKGTRRVNKFTMWLARRGLGRQVVLTTTGRRSGEPRSVPVSPLDIKGTGYIVSPYGEVSWVKNVRENKSVHLRQGRQSRDVTLAEVPPGRRGELLHQYWKQERITRPYFDVPSDPDPSDFAAVAQQHPVFKIVT
ncbi:MAG: nitroreductase family deazaflavin-dependent oxidoreductase [Actinobacteria bacterium]|nr:MAG: nitroreductase family deazaflavin-dependent oxidoreductase [Actinomycetota bacterium]